MSFQYTISIRDTSYRALVKFLQKTGSGCGFVCGEAGAGKTHIVFRALNQLNYTYLYIKYDQFAQKELLPLRIIKRIPNIAKQPFQNSTGNEYDWLAGRNELNYECKNKLTEMVEVVKNQVVLVIDDFQWATDGDIADFLDYIPNPLPKNLKLILIARDDADYRGKIEFLLSALEKFDRATVISLLELEFKDTEKYINELALYYGLDIDQEIRANIVASANNNPFHIKLMLDGVRNNLGLQKAFTSINTVSSLLDAILNRELRYILFVAAQIGFHVPKALIQSYFVFSPKLIQDKLDQLISTGILLDLETDEALSFAHDKVYEASKNLFTSQNLKEVNRRLFNIFSQDESLDLQEKDTSMALFLIRSDLTHQRLESVERIFINGLKQSLRLFMLDASKNICDYLVGDITRCRFFGDSQLSLELVILIAKSYYQLGMMDKAITFLDYELRLRNDDIEQSEILFAKSEMHFSSQDLPSAKRQINEALSKVGHSRGVEDVAASAYALFQGAILQRSLTQSTKLQSLERVCHDRRIQQYNKCLINAVTYHYSSEPFKAALYLMRVLQNSIRSGSTVETSLALMLFAAGVVGGLYRSYDKAIYLSEYAMFLSTKLSSRYYFVRNLFTYDCFLSYLENRVDVTIGALEESFDRCLKVGAMDLASYGVYLIGLLSVDASHGLRDTKLRVLSLTERLSKYNLKITETWSRILLQFIDDRIEERKNGFMNGNYFSMRELSNISDKTAYYGAFHHRGQSWMLIGNWSKAKADFRTAKKYQLYGTGTYLVYLTEFYLGVCEARSAGPYRINLIKIERIEKQLRFLSKPDAMSNQTLLGKRAILQGYIDYLKGNREQARQKFLKAAKISLALGHALDRLLALDAMSLVEDGGNLQDEIDLSRKSWLGEG